jgi:hypothetical protein
MTTETDERILAWEAKKNLAKLLVTQHDLEVVAEDAICDMTRLGAEKYDPDEWRTETPERHIRRSIKHALTALEIAAGDRPDDGEDHMQAAVCRMAMACWITKEMG